MLSASRRQPHLLHVSTVDHRWWSGNAIRGLLHPTGKIVSTVGVLMKSLCFEKLTEYVKLKRETCVWLNEKLGLCLQDLAVVEHVSLWHVGSIPVARAHSDASSRCIRKCILRHPGASGNRSRADTWVSCADSPRGKEVLVQHYDTFSCRLWGRVHSSSD